MRKRDDLGIKFWKKWLKANSLKRIEIVGKLPLFVMSLSMKNNKMWRRSFAGLVNSYFEDLKSAIYASNIKLSR